MGGAILIQSLLFVLYALCFNILYIEFNLKVMSGYSYLKCF
jgi:hypothetical protein